MKTVSFYIQLKPKFMYWDKEKVETVSAVRLTNKKPDPAIAGTVTVKLTINVPESIFKPFMPTAEIEIPESLAEQNIEVLAEDPRDADQVASA